MCSSIYMMVLSFHLAKSAIIYLQPIKHYLKTHTRIHISLLSVLHEIKPYRLLDVWSMHQPLIMKTHLTLFFEMENQSNCLGLFKWQMLPSILSLSWLDSAHIECKVIYIMHTFMAYSIIRWGGEICNLCDLTRDSDFMTSREANDWENGSDSLFFSRWMILGLTFNKHQTKALKQLF